MGEIEALNNGSYLSKQIQKGGSGAPYQGHPETKNHTNEE